MSHKIQISDVFIHFFTKHHVSTSTLPQEGGLKFEGVYIEEGSLYYMWEGGLGTRFGANVEQQLSSKM